MPSTDLLNASSYWYVGMQYNHLYLITSRPPVLRPIDGREQLALYMDPGDCGIPPIVCGPFVERMWPKAYAMLRPLQYVNVPLYGGDPIGEVIKPKEVA